MSQTRRDRTSILIATIARMTRVCFDQRARALGLTRPQWRTLNCIIYSEGATLTRIADIIEVEPITAGRIIDALEAMGLVERRLHATDRRLRLIHSTPAAEPVIREMRVLSDAIEAELYAGMTGADLATLERLLAAVHRNLADSQARAGRNGGGAATAAPQGDQIGVARKRRISR